MKKTQVKTKIQEAVLTLLQQKAITDIKVKELIDLVGISRATFYLYYDSIYAVLQEMEDTYLEGFEQIAQKNMEVPLDDLYFNIPHPIMCESLHYVYAHKALVLTLFGPFGDRRFHTKCRELSTQYFIQKVLTEYYNVTDVANDPLTLFFLGGNYNMVLNWLAQKEPMSVEDLTLIIYQVMCGNYLKRNRLCHHFSA